MAYLLHRLPPIGRSALVVRSALLVSIARWSKAHSVEFDHDVAGYEFHLHFTSPEDLSFFLLSFEDPTLFKIVE